MKFVSLRWKLALTLIAITASVAGVYVYIAKSTFESDKIAYVFSFQQIHVSGSVAHIEQQFEQTAWDARTLTANFDPARNGFSEMGQELFNNHHAITALELTDATDQRVIFKLEKGETRLPGSAPASVPGNPALTVQALGNDRFLLTSFLQGEGGRPLVLRTQATLKDVLPTDLKGGDFLLFESGRLVSGTNNIRGAEALPTLFGGFRSPATALKKLSGVSYLVSAKPIAYSNLALVELMPAAEALSALKKLYRHSIIFLAASGLLVAFLAWMLSEQLTFKLAVLARNAQEIGRGNFSQVGTVKSNDEVGVLGTAFVKMSAEIQRLLKETTEKTRMESELQTARLVQESLMPAQKVQAVGSIRLAGVSVSSTECSGDWWHTFRRGDYLYVIVADATGHGTPSALITSATRSIFSYLEKVELELPQMAQIWDEAVASCSNNKVFMTGVIVKMHIETGAAEVLSASHEPPLRWSRAGGKFTADSILTKQSMILGHREANERQTASFELQPNEFLLLYSDGLFSVVDAKGGEISEGRVVRLISGLLNDSPHTCESALNDVIAKINELRGENPLPDDITAVMLTRAPMFQVLS